MTRFHVIALALLAVAFPIAARAECEALFVGGRAPALLNPRMAQRTTFLCNDAYAALASGVTRGPLWSAEHLTAPDLAQARVTPREGTFHDEERLPPDDRATVEDYTNSGYDRGHMTPSGDMPDQQRQEQSFSLANVVPQAPNLNRRTWAGVESEVRKLAEREGELYVVTGPTFQGQSLQSLKGRVLVPSSVWKAVYDPVARGAGAYICTNVNRPRCTTMAVAALMRITSIDPFPALPDAVKRVALRLPRPGAAGHRRRTADRTQ